MKKMKVMKGLVPFIIWGAIMLIGISANSQPIDFPYLNSVERKKNLPDNSFRIYMGSGIPIGNFRSSEWRNGKAGYAKTGFFTNIEGIFPLHYKKTRKGSFTFSGTLGSFLAGNKSNFGEKIKEVKEPFTEEHFSARGEIVDFKSQSGWWWFFNPFMGARADFRNSSSSGIYMSAGAGAMIGRFPSKRVNATIQNGSGAEEYEFKRGPAVGSGISVNLGGGIVINGKFDLSLHYLYGIPQYLISAPNQYEELPFTQYIENEMPTSIIQAGVSIYL